MATSFRSALNLIGAFVFFLAIIGMFGTITQLIFEARGGEPPADEHEAYSRMFKLCFKISCSLIFGILSGLSFLGSIAMSLTIERQKKE